MTRHRTLLRSLSLCTVFALLLHSLPCSADMDGRAKEEDNKLVYRDQGQTIVIEGWGDDSLRVRITPDGGKQTSDWALDIPLHRPAQIEITPQTATIRNGKISARISDIYTQRGHLQFFKHTGDKSVPILCEYDYVVHAHNPGTRIFKPTGDGLFECELHFESRDGERLYGMGENATGRVNLKGSVIDLYQRHVKAVVPFVVSSEGYGFLWNNPSLGRVEFGNNRTRWVSYGCRQIDYFITAGDSYADIMEHYADATGHAPEFPYWASGFWQCKLRYQNQEEFLAVAREFKRRKLPLSVLVIDFLHWDVMGNWRLDPKYWPDPKAMVKELDEMGARIMISPWPLVDPHSENYLPMKEQGLFTGSIGGRLDTVDFDGPKYQYDPTNPEAAKFLWSKWKQNYVDLGIKTFWLDSCDEFHNIQDYDQVLFQIGPAKEAHAIFPVAHQKNIYEGLIAAGEKEVVTICRNAWAGSQRYGACPAPHDIMSSFEHLEEYMKVGLNVMMSGIPWWSCDIGGFVTPDNSSPYFQELMVRWYQYGVFLPVFRTHGNRPNNEPWTIGGTTYPLIRSSILLRERLRPYVMAQMKLASAKGLPPMRPLFFDFSSDAKTADLEDEFLFGPDILVAPVTQFEMRKRMVYLPAGIEWTDAWTGQLIAGGQTVEAEAPIDHIPVYLRGNQPELLRIFRSQEMYSFRFEGLGEATIDGSDIRITVPHGTDVTSLIPICTFSSGCTCSPASGTHVNFSTAQTYTITGPDGSTNEYLVQVRFGTTYDFNNQSLQGWHNRVWDGATLTWVDLAPNVTAIPKSINGGAILPPNDGNSLYMSHSGGWTGSLYYPVILGGGSYLIPGNLDVGGNTKWVRSPEFHLDGSGDLTFKLIYGPPGGIPPANESEVHYNASQGWSGLCLRDASTGQFVLSQPGTNTSNAYTGFSFPAAQLAKLNQTHAYTLDLITTKAGFASWIALDDVSIPGIVMAKNTNVRD